MGSVAQGIGNAVGLGGVSYKPESGSYAPNVQENEYINKLRVMAYGNAPSPAQLQMQAGLEQSTANAQALASSQRGISPGLAARLAAKYQAETAQGVNQNAAINRLQEQQGMMGMLGNELQSVRTGAMGQQSLQANLAENAQNRRINVLGGLAGGASSAFMPPGGAHFEGGLIDGYAFGGRPGMEPAESPAYAQAAPSPQMQSSGWQPHPFKGGFQTMPMMAIPQAPNVQTMSQPSMVGAKMMNMASGGRIDMAAQGGHVPGKAMVKGDSPKNDTVPAMLSPGEIVIPKSILEHEHAGEMAKSFVEGILASKKKDNVKQNFADGGVMHRLYESISGSTPEEESQAPQENTLVNPQTLPDQNEPAQNMSVGTATPPSIQAPQAQLDPYGFEKANNAALQGINMQQAGIFGEAKGQQALNKAEYEAAKPYEDNAADLTNKMQQLQSNWDLDSQKFAQEANTKIDPNHYLNSMNTASKVKTAVGLILGGLSSGMTGKNNPALDFMNNQIDRDIRGQEINMNQKNNLFKMNMELFGDRMQALAKTKADLLATAEYHMKMEGLKSSNPLIQARAEQAAGQLGAQRAQLYGQIAQRKVLMEAMGGANGSPEKTLQAMDIVDPERAKEMRKRFVPGAGFASIDVPDSARQQMSSRMALDKAVQDLESFARKHEGTVMDRSVVDIGKTKAKLVQDMYRRANAQGVFKESEANFVNSIVKQDPTAFFANWRTLPAYKTLRQANKAELNTMYQTYGLKPQLDISKFEGKPK